MGNKINKNLNLGMNKVEEDDPFFVDQNIIDCMTCFINESR